MYPHQKIMVILQDVLTVTRWGCALNKALDQIYHGRQIRDMVPCCGSQGKAQGLYIRDSPDQLKNNGF